MEDDARRDEASPTESFVRVSCLASLATWYRLRLPLPSPAARKGHAAAWSVILGFCCGEGWAAKNLLPDPLPEDVRAAVVEILGASVPRRLTHGPAPRLNYRVILALRACRAEGSAIKALARLQVRDPETWDVFGQMSDPSVDPEAREAAQILTTTADPEALRILLEDEYTRTAIVAELVFRGYKLTRDEAAGRPPWWGVLLAELAKSGNISAGAQAAGVGRATVYNWRDKSPELAEELAAALEEHARTNGKGEDPAVLDPDK